ncbi:hypothetical protein F5984_15760 [Rudanella paleaurantiibacter]|uniref:pPIWI-RE three-gene island domain-containing protein n=1 Tax=Rudanella paleaurantiibacter TaxID=2614655 RepID=A0A7J5TWU7_9BACT|nr:hypothetical protein [Rudanella paleaurantiibacter]KAB7729104.1 hypothetical protein F5984_15760 [Rudanella paleaurantiibacter]
MNTATLLSSSQRIAPATQHLMRWQEPLATRLRYGHNLPGQVANRLLNVELGLYLLAELLPMAPPEALPDLLNGRESAYLKRPVWTPKQHRYLSRCQLLLAPYKDRATWFNALAKYNTLPIGPRVFTLNANGVYRSGVDMYALHERLILFRRALM